MGLEKYLIGSGKVRELYDLGSDGLLLVASTEHSGGESYPDLDKFKRQATSEKEQTEPQMISPLKRVTSTRQP